MSEYRERYVADWRCPDGHPPGEFQIFYEDDKCPECGVPLREVSVREERRITWSGERPSGAYIRSALDLESPLSIWGRGRQKDSDEHEYAAFLLSRESELRMAGSKVDVLIVAALAKELNAIRANSGPWSLEHDASGIEYYLTSVYHSGLRIALAGMTGMGPVNAAVATSLALSA